MLNRLKKTCKPEQPINVVHAGLGNCRPLVTVEGPIAPPTKVQSKRIQQIQNNPAPSSHFGQVWAVYLSVKLCQSLHAPAPAEK